MLSAPITSHLPMPGCHPCSRYHRCISLTLLHTLPSPVFVSLLPSAPLHNPLLPPRSNPPSTPPPLQEVVISHQGHRCVRFTVDRWLADDEGDKQTWVTLSPDISHNQRTSTAGSLASSSHERISSCSCSSGPAGPVAQQQSKEVPHGQLHQQWGQAVATASDALAAVETSRCGGSEGATTTYRVTVYTSDLREAGTDGGVWVQLIGEGVEDGGEGGQEGEGGCGGAGAMVVSHDLLAGVGVGGGERRGRARLTIKEPPDDHSQCSMQFIVR